MSKMARRTLALAFVMVLVLALSGTALANFNITVKPLASDIGNDGIDTEVGYRVLDCLDIFAGYEYYNDRQSYGGSDEYNDTYSMFTLGARYYLAEIGSAEPFVFGTYSTATYSSSWDIDVHKESLRKYELGLGVAYNISPNWAIVAETGCARVAYEDKESDYEETTTWTFTDFGLKFSF